MDTSRLSMLAISDTGFVFDPRTGHSYTVNSTGLTVLSALKKGCSPSDVIGQLEESFEAPGNLRADLHAFVESLHNYELLVPEGSGQEAR